MVKALEDAHNDSRLRYDWLPGANHGALARAFYLKRTYEWLFRHTLDDPWRPVDTTIDITRDDLSHVYQEFKRRTDQLEVELNSRDVEPEDDFDDAAEEEE